MPIYRGVPVDIFIHNISAAEPLISGVYDAAMQEPSYRQEWGGVASYWHSHITSHSTLVRLMNARHAETPKAAAKAIRASQIEEAFTFFHPYFLTAMQTDIEAGELHNSLYNAGCFDGVSLREVRRSDIRDIIENHHGYFISNGMYAPAPIPNALYNAYFICRADDKIERFQIQANAAPGAADEGELAEVFEGAIDPKTYDGYDFTARFEGDGEEGEEEEPAAPGDAPSRVESWQVNLRRIVHPQFEMPPHEQKMLKWFIADTLRELRQLDEVREFAHMDFATGPFVCQRPTFVGTDYAASRLAGTLPPRFRIYDSFMQPLPAPC